MASPQDVCVRALTCVRDACVSVCACDYVGVCALARCLTGGRGGKAYSRRNAHTVPKGGVGSADHGAGILALSNNGSAPVHLVLVTEDKKTVDGLGLAGDDSFLLSSTSMLRSSYTRRLFLKTYACWLARALAVRGLELFVSLVSLHEDESTTPGVRKALLLSDPCSLLLVRPFPNGKLT